MQVGISGVPVSSHASALTGEAGVGLGMEGGGAVAGINFAVSITNMAPLVLLLEFR